MTDRIVIENLHKRFGDVVALAGVDLSVADGEFLGLLGPSGCGKTTTLNLVAGFEEPSGGRIMLDGRDIARVPANRRGLGIVFQSYALFPHLTAAENVAFGLEMRGIDRGARALRVNAALDLVKLAHAADRYPRQLSGGQQQRVAVARALVIEPSLLLLDEPLSNLDAKLREEMQVELRAIQRRTGLTAVIVTHDQAEALAMCDRIAVMDRGRIVQLTDPLTLYDRPATAFVAGFVGRSSRLSGRVAGRSGDRVQVRLAGDAGTLDALAGVGLAHDTPVMLAVRPEKVLLSAEAEGVITGRVESRIFQGNTWLFIVETPAGRVEVVALHQGRPAVEEGQRVGLRFGPEDAVAVAADLP